LWPTLALPVSQGGVLVWGASRRQRRKNRPFCRICARQGSHSRSRPWSRLPLLATRLPANQTPSDPGVAQERAACEANVECSHGLTAPTIRRSPSRTQPHPDSVIHSQCDYRDLCQRLALMRSSITTMDATRDDAADDRSRQCSHWSLVAGDCHSARTAGASPAPSALIPFWSRPPLASLMLNCPPLAASLSAAKR
jgi:hypothetical protein